MSINIHDGLIATNNNVFTVSKRIREILEPVFLDKFANFYMELRATGNTVAEAIRKQEPKAFFILDDEEDFILKNRITDDYRAKYVIDSDLWRMIQGLDKTSTHTFSDLDISYNVNIIENKVVGGNPLIAVFGEQSREYRQLLLDAGVVREYGYWDGSDQDEDISDAEWNERKLAWSVLHEGIGKSFEEVSVGFGVPGVIRSSIYATGQYSKHRQSEIDSNSAQEPIG